MKTYKIIIPVILKFFKKNTVRKKPKPKATKTIGYPKTYLYP